MPKAKTKSGAKKRFQVTGSGKIKRKSAYKRHILTKKSTKRRRRLGNDALVHPSDMKSIKAQLLASA
jgi:large subunit ribosomal protein L35